MGRQRSLLVVSLLMGITLNCAVWAFSLEEVFRPFEFLDIAEMYEHYSGIVDLFIYLLIFTGTAHVTLGKRFAGRGAKAISAGTGICLAIAMIIAEEKFGFSIRSFGPVAAGILVLLLGVMIYRLFHYMGMVRAGAWSVAYVTIFIAMHAIAPEFFIWLDENIPVLNVVALIALIMAIIGSILPLLHTGTDGKTFEMRLHQYAMPGRNREHDALRKEVKFIKRGIRPIAKKAVKESDGTVEDLQSVGKAINRYGHIPQARKIIIEQMARILPKEHELQNRIMQLRDLNMKMLRFDSSIFSEKSGLQFNNMSPEEKNGYRKEIKDEIERIDLEKQVQQIEQKLEQCMMETNQYLTFAGEALKEGKAEESLQAIDGAVASEREISELTQRVKKLEGILLSLAKLDLKIEKHKIPS